MGVANDSKGSSKDSKGDLKYIRNLTEIFGRDSIPIEFDYWSAREQYDWINQNITKFVPNMPRSLRNFGSAFFHPVRYDRPVEQLPEWMDMDKYCRAQEFVHKHYAAIVVSKLLGLIYVYSFQDQVKTVILQETGHTPYLGFKKYLSSVSRILSWYDGEPWVTGTRAYKDMQITRQKHLAVRQKMDRLSIEQIDAASKFENPWCPDRELFLKDFAAACPFAESYGQRPYVLVSKSPYRPKGVSIADLIGVQSIFVVLFVLHPQNIGVYDATDEDLEAFCHMWRYYGYLLGIDDQCNFCRGTLEEIRQRTRDFYEYWVIPNLKEVTPEWEHMTRCLIEPLNYYPFVYSPYKSMVLIATDALNIKMPNLYASLTYAEWFAYKFYKFVIYALRAPKIRAVVNRIVTKIYNAATKYDSKKLAEIHEKSKKLLPDFSIKWDNKGR